MTTCSVTVVHGGQSHGVRVVPQAVALAQMMKWCRQSLGAGPLEEAVEQGWTAAELFSRGRSGEGGCSTGSTCPKRLAATVV